MIGWFFRRFIRLLSLLVHLLFILVAKLLRSSLWMNLSCYSLIHMTWKCMIILFTFIPSTITRKMRQIIIASLFIDIANILDNLLILNALRLVINGDLFSNPLHLFLFLASKICIFLWRWWWLISRFLSILYILVILLWWWRFIFIVSSCLLASFLGHFFRYDSG